MFILILFLILGTVTMTVLAFLNNKIYHFTVLKILLLMPILVISGVLGAMLMYFIETGMWGGISYYGAVFFIPIGILIFSLISKTGYSQLLDFVSPCVCLMLAVLKIHCLVSGCCGGIKLFENAVGECVYFPSQIVECLLSLVIMTVLLIFDKKNICSGYHYPLYMVIYGIARFGINFLRLEKEPFVWILSAGHFWSLISIFIGIISILLIFFIKRRSRYKS